MSAPGLDEFGRRVRELDREALTRFVADLYAARGFETTVTGDDRFAVTRSREGEGETRTLRVAKSLPSDPVAEDAVVLARRTDVRSTGDAEVIDLTALYRMALYAVEREQFRTLSAEYFDGEWTSDGDDDGDKNPVASLANRWTALGPSAEPLRMPSGPALAVLLAVSIVAALAVATSGPGGPTTEYGIERTVTPAPVSTQQQATSTDGFGPAQAACPAPPAGVHPATFRPTPVEAALSTGLESWEIRLGVNVSTFFAPTELQIRWMPERRHESTYRTPEGDSIVLTVDQWNSSVAAEKAGRALAAEYGEAVVWGQYTFTVTYHSAPTNTSVERTTARATSRLLLSQVASPDGGKLGRECLDVLLVERAA